MFKPSLKRSKLQQIQLYTKKYLPPHQQHARVKDGSRQQAERQSFEIQQNIIFPTSFYEAQHKTKTESSLVFNPLNYEWHDYPHQIKKLMQSQASRDGTMLGSYKDLIWYHQNQLLCIWNRKDRQVYKFQMHKDTNCIQIGQIQSSSLHFMTRNLYIVAAGVTNRFFLFGIDKVSFAMSDLRFNYEILNSRYIQRIKFINENEIVVGSDTSYFCHFDFQAETRISCNYIPLIKRALPYLPLLYPDSCNFIEDIVTTRDLMYVLVREEKAVSWLSVNAKKALNLLLMKNEEVKYIIERKRVEVYELNRQNNTISLLHKITEQEFIKRLKSKHPQVCEIKDPQGLKIVSIYLSKSDTQNGSLSIVTKCGYFVTLNQTENVIIGSSLLKAPKENNIGVVGLYLQKKDIEDQNFSKDNQVTMSFGINNLTLMNNCLWYISQGVLQPVKCDKIQGGDIIEVRNDGFQGQKWWVFTKTGYFKVSRLTVYEVFLSYLLVRNNMSSKSPEKFGDQSSSFQLFLQNLSKIIGYEKICESLIDCLLRDKIEFKIAQPIFHMIEDQLRGYSNKNYRDWTYTLSKSTPSVQVTLADNMFNEVWKYLIELQSKLPKVESQHLSSMNITCNAYWYALRNVFVKYSAPLLKVEAKNVKAKINKIDDSIRFLQTLTKFFFLKKEREMMKYLNQSILSRSNSKKEKPQPKVSVTRLKPITAPQLKKDDDKTQISIDQSSLIIQQNKFVNESSTKLQDVITLSIKRLKSMVNIFLYLADINENEQIGNIQQILRSRKERMTVRKYLIARVIDGEKLEEFARVLPELELTQAMNFNKWYNFQQKNNRPEMANLTEISTFISSEGFEKIRNVFQGRYDCHTDLLLLYWDHLFGEMNTIHKRQYLESKQNELFSAERAHLQNQLKEYIGEETKAISAQVKLIVTNTIKAYISSNQEDYPKAQKMINNVIKILAQHDDRDLIAFAQQEMGKSGLAEKLILLRKNKKKYEVPMTATEILTKRKHVQNKPKTEREFLSNYDLYLLEPDQ